MSALKQEERWERERERLGERDGRQRDRGEGAEIQSVHNYSIFQSHMYGSQTRIHMRNLMMFTIMIITKFLIG